MSAIKMIGVVGAGTMGHGIAQVFAQAGFEVFLIDQNKTFVEKGLSKIKTNLERAVEKGKLSTDESQKIFNRITVGDQLSILKDADLVVEAIIESEDVKSKLFGQLDKICKPDAILASNTSSISITKLAACTSRPQNVVGMHFMNPVPVMKLVEIIRGQLTNDETMKAIVDLTVKLGKTPVEAHDYPGFIANRILMPMINEAILAYAEGVGSKEAIDTTMKLGMSHPMGPLELADFIGLDVCLAILEVLESGFKNPKYRPAPLLREMVNSGKLGRKSGEGFYRY